MVRVQARWYKCVLCFIVPCTYPQSWVYNYATEDFATFCAKKPTNDHTDLFIRLTYGFSLHNTHCI